MKVWGLRGFSEPPANPFVTASMYFGALEVQGFLEVVNGGIKKRLKGVMTSAKKAQGKLKGLRV